MRRYGSAQGRANVCALLAMAACVACNDDTPAHKRGVDQAYDGLTASNFPGAGKGGASLPLSAGTAAVACDQPSQLPAGTFGPAPGAVATRECYYDADHPDDPAATMEWVVESAAEGELVHARLTFNPRFVDNTYGENAIGWQAVAKPGPAPKPMPKPMPMPKAPGGAGGPAGMAPKPGPGGHTFKDLVGSDHAEFTLSDADGVTKLKFKADYISESASAPSGYASLGVTGGEGKMLIGSADAVVAVSTSLDRDLNTCGYGDYLESSPETDENYTVNPAAPNWDYRVVYDVWVERSAFAASGFGRASVAFVHASPSKAGKASIDVVTGDCPPKWPPYCSGPDGCEPKERCGDEPDESCTANPPCDGGECAHDTDGGLPLF
jgi:hypothetical protein